MHEPKLELKCRQDDLLEDLVSVETLEMRVGDRRRARRLLKKTGVKVIEGHFSASALLRALGDEDLTPRVSREEKIAPARLPTGETLLYRIEWLLKKYGLGVKELAQRRTLEGVLVAPEGRVVIYGTTSNGSDDIDISAETPRHARIFTKDTERNGSLEFTVGKLDTGAPEDFLIFIGPRTDRFWILSVQTAARIHRELLAGRDANRHKGFTLHSSPHTLRVQLSRQASLYDSHIALADMPLAERCHE
jgi:hypothetical protein